MSFFSYIDIFGRSICLVLGTSYVLNGNSFSMITMFIGKRNEYEGLSAFLKIIFLLTKSTGTFPFQLSKEKDLVKNNGVFYTFLPLLLTCINVVFLLKNYAKPTTEEYFSIIVQIITHANCAIYVFIPFFNRTRIQFAINTCLIRITRESNHRTLFVFSFITLVFVLWVIFNLIKPIMDGDILSVLLFVEKSILGLLELQMCFLLHYMKGAFLDIRENIKNTMKCENRFHTMYFIRNTPIVWSKRTLESCRKEHLIVYKAMENLNAAYGLANFILTMRERFSFAFHLYFWINKGRIFDVILAGVNFFEFSLLFYSFQVLKNEELELKRFVKALDFDREENVINQVELLKKQVRLLTIKFEACGLFSMDLNMIISIITTTAGYLLLLNQLKL